MFLYFGDLGKCEFGLAERSRSTAPGMCPGNTSVTEETAMRKAAQINLVVHYPKTEEGWKELRKRVAEVHVEAVMTYVRKLNCPHWKKIKLIDAVIADARMQIEAEKQMEEADERCLNRSISDG